MAAPKQSSPTTSPRKGTDLKNRSAGLKDNLARPRGKQVPKSESASPASLSDLTATLMPLLIEAEGKRAHVCALYEQTERSLGEPPALDAGTAVWLAWHERRRTAQVDSGYSAAWDAVQPLLDRINKLVQPLMSVPTRTLDDLVLKRRIGFTLDQYEDDATADLDRLAKACTVWGDGTLAIEKPATIEQAAAMLFDGYDFDTPLRSPREWADRLRGGDQDREADVPETTVPDAAWPFPWAGSSNVISAAGVALLNMVARR